MENVAVHPHDCSGSICVKAAARTPGRAAMWSAMAYAVRGRQIRRQVHRQHVRRRHSGVGVAQPAELADEQTRADDEHEGERNLRDGERVTKSSERAARPSERGSALQRLVRVRPRGGECRKQAEERRPVTTDPAAGIRSRASRPRSRRARGTASPGIDSRSGSPHVTTSSASASADRGNQHAFGEELSHEPCAPGADRRSHGELARLAPIRARAADSPRWRTPRGARGQPPRAE